MPPLPTIGQWSPLGTSASRGGAGKWSSVPSVRCPRIIVPVSLSSDYHGLSSLYHNHTQAQHRPPPHTGIYCDCSFYTCKFFMIPPLNQICFIILQEMLSALTLWGLTIRHLWTFHGSCYAPVSPSRWRAAAAAAVKMCHDIIPCRYVDSRYVDM